MARPDATLDGGHADVTAEAVVIDGALATDAGADDLDKVLEALRAAGVDVAVVDPGDLDALDALRDRLAARGIGPGLVLLVGAAALRAAAGRPGWNRATRRSATRAFEAVEALRDQLDRRSTGRVPWVDEDPAWCLVASEGTELGHRDPHVQESLLTVADGRFGARGALEGDTEGRALVFAAGVYDHRSDRPLLLEAPIWTALVTNGLDAADERRVLDLRTGVLVRECRLHGETTLRTIRFLSLDRPGAAVLRAEGASSRLRAGHALHLPDHAPEAGRTRDATGEWAWTGGRDGGGISVSARTVERRTNGLRTIDRVAAYVADPCAMPAREESESVVEDLAALGFDRLLTAHREAWAARWADASVSIDGDPDLELAVRLAIFHLIGSVASDGEAAVGPRGLSGGAYGGHVLWDADVFVLPVLAATYPSAARAMLEYRLRRLPAARDIAAREGHEGARFPWESGADGYDITPNLVRKSGQIIPILTGQHEEHVIADVAWAAWQYCAWTGDAELLAGPGGALLTDTARYWASRVRWIDGRAHIFGVVGPDEYHEIVDDNAFTNVMARWNLRRAADVLEGAGDPDGEASGWRRVADALVDGYDEATGCYEQCAGFWGLTPTIIRDLHPLPLMADEVLGRDTVRRSQVIKQPDVLMLHHLVPEETAPASLEPNLDLYLPRCSHGSSLSPAIHASLLARAGRPEEALELFRLACRLDLDDLTGTSQRGLHTATMGGVWQALAFGFAGLWPEEHALRIDPHLPRAWRSVTVTVRFHGARVEVTARPTDIEVRCDAPLTVRVGGRDHAITPPGLVI